MKFGEWTPYVRESMPEPKEFGTRYLCTLNGSHVLCLTWVKTLLRGKEVYRWEYRGGPSCWTPIAVMPLPEAYKDGE